MAGGLLKYATFLVLGALLLAQHGRASYGNEKGTEWPLLLEQVSALPDLYEASVAELGAGLNAGIFTSVDLVKAYFARIDEVNLHGPALRAVIEKNPSALAEAAALDAERTLLGPRGLLHGVPVLVKDNIATVVSEGMNTTAGSFSLEGSIVPGDAGVVKRLRAAGAIILGKANLSEFSHARGTLAPGWSGRGGQCTAAYYPGADPCGSSSGSGVAASIGLASVTLGTETDGSITCPASRNNVVGIKPTVGLTSRAGVIPITAHQDTVGPLVRSVSDAAIVLSVIAGPDPNDNYTLAQPSILPDYLSALNTSALQGTRIGVPRAVFLEASYSELDDTILSAYTTALETLKTLGATIVDPADLPSAYEIATSKNESVVSRTDFKVQLNAWFESLLSNPSGVRSMADLIAYNDAHPELEEPSNYTDQSTLIRAEASEGFNSTYYQSLAYNHELGRTRGIDAALKKYDLDALVLPAAGYVTMPAAIAGYPIVTVPLGFYPDNTPAVPTGPATFYPAPGVPFGLSFLGTAYSEYNLIGYAYAYEQKTMTRLQRKAYAAAIPSMQLVNVIGKQ
ncbi:amidase signature enzyme [Neolentinus lepideus HHB14362 ss-1]|uniref:Amidase signature enzyme n=1 Tax=Neolentinus lepideus HHB14362 ss-1 TaxID=1314782 RepID=A0A165UQ00_9AGAM|nr:amidase signature enzyme [Neolentinus lepideus HHB14362 ss-1]